MDISLAQALKEIADAKELIRKMLYEYQRLCLIKKRDNCRSRAIFN